MPPIDPLSDFSVSTDAMPNYLLQLAEEEKRRQAELDAAREQLRSTQDQPMELGKGIGTALLALAPAAIGGLVNGREGVYQGSLAGLAGTDAYGKNMQATDQREDQLNLLDYKEALDSHDKVQNLLDLSGAKNAEMQDSLAGRIGLKKLDILNRPTLAADRMLPTPIQEMYSKLHPELAGVPLNEKAAKIVSGLDNSQMRADDIEIRKAESKRRMMGAVAAYDAANSLGKFGYIHRTSVDPKTDTDMAKADEAINNITQNEDRLLELLKKTGGDRPLTGDEAASFDRYVASTKKEFALLKGMGANWTLPEMKVGNEVLGVGDSYADTILKKNVLGRDLIKSIEDARALNMRNYFNKLASKGIFVRDRSYADVYSPSEIAGLKKDGFQFNQKGEVINQDAAGAFRQRMVENLMRISALSDNDGTSSNTNGFATSTNSPPAVSEPAVAQTSSDTSIPDAPPGYTKELRNGQWGYLGPRGWFSADKLTR